jgi:hypothetical protein
MVELPTTYCYSRLLLPELATCGIKVVHKFSGIQELSYNLEYQMSIE